MTSLELQLWFPSRHEVSRRLFFCFVFFSFFKFAQLLDISCFQFSAGKSCKLVLPLLYLVTEEYIVHTGKQGKHLILSFYLPSFQDNELVLSLPRKVTN